MHPGRDEVRLDLVAERFEQIAGAQNSVDRIIECKIGYLGPEYVLKRLWTAVRYL